MSQQAVATLFVYGAILLLVTAAVWDALTLTIPNPLVVAVLALYVVSLAVSFNSSSILFDLLGGAIVFAVCFALFALGWLGGGDAKLAPGAALWVGFGGLLHFLVAMTLVGGLLAIVLLIVRGGLRPTATQENLPVALRWASPVPYGIAISAGAILVLWLQNRTVFPDLLWFRFAPRIGVLLDQIERSCCSV